MNNRIFYYTLSFLLLVFIHATQAQFSVDVETGLVFNNTYNQVRIPGNTGTSFDLAKDFTGNNTFFYRIRASFTLSDRHTFTALYAPLSITSTGVLPKPVAFNGSTFQPNTAIKGVYTFNSYRLTYRYNFIRNEKFILGAGVTAKIRDAYIQLSNEQVNTTKSNVGFVPLINFYLRWDFTDRLLLILEGDALAASQGRAEDIFTGLGYQIIPDKLAIKAGYRLLEGGADNDEVYNFTWLNYASAGILITL